jgi:PKD domain/FlgD Ig-like domain
MRRLGVSLARFIVFLAFLSAAPVLPPPAMATTHPTLSTTYGAGHVGQQIYAYVTVNDPDNVPITSLTVDASNLPPGDPTSFVVSQGNLYGTFAWTPAAPGYYTITFTAVDGTGYTATASTTVIATHTPPTLSTFGGAGPAGQPVYAYASVYDPDDIGIASLTVDTSGLPPGDLTTFDVSTDHRYGTLTWLPAAPGTHTITLTMLDETGYTATAGATVTALNPLPIVTAPIALNVHPGDSVDFTVTVYEPYGPIVSLSADLSALPQPNNAMFTVNATNTEGHFTWTPRPEDFLDETGYLVKFAATDGTDHGVGVATTGIFPSAEDVNRPPIADAGGPYQGVAGVAVAFDGTGSSDPDGDALTYAWNFGDDARGVGARISHTYAAGGQYRVSLTVTDGSGAENPAATQASILDALAARAYAPAGQTAIRLDTPKPFNTVQIEPVDADFEVGDVDLSSIRMASPGTGSVTEIGPVLGKTAVVSDRDGNGVPEIEASFGKLDLRRLFDGLAPGQHDVTVALEGKVSSGARFTTSLGLSVIVNGNVVASISPNPMNPEATLTFQTSREGPVHAALYDLHGRKVRTLLDAGGLAAGYHDVRIDGRNDSGGRLASGVYFVAIESPDGNLRSKVTILR